MSVMVKKSMQPIISCRIEPTGLLVFALSVPHRFGVESFLAEMLSTHLLPGVRLQLERFRLSCCDGYLEGDMAVQLQGGQVERVRRSLDLFTHELGLGIASSFYGAQLLEMGGGDKRALVHEHLSRLIHRFPNHFDYGLLSLVQHLFLDTSETFRAERGVRHLARIATSLYAVDAHVARRVAARPRERHVSVKIGEATVQEPLRRRSVTTVTAAITTLSDREFVTEKHLWQAIRALSPEAQSIPEASFRRDFPEDGLRLFYVEVEADGGSLDGLAEAFAGRVERLMPPLFMPRNEEEVMRGLLALASQITYLRDLPQAIISFDKQGEESVTFTVILVRLAIGEVVPWKALFQATAFRLEKERDVGRLRQKYDKEGAVLSLSLPIAPYVRQEGSVDLLAAREDVSARLRAIIGEFRDYNGGTLSKEAEQLASLREAFPSTHHDYVENIFCAIEPPHMRATAAMDLLIAIVSALLEKRDVVRTYDTYSVRVAQEAIASENALLFGSIGDYSFVLIQ